jgi:hypothetical protein
MTTPQYNRQAQAWDNKTPDSEDGLPPTGVCSWCKSKLIGHLIGGEYIKSCVMTDCHEYDSDETEQSNRARWLREEADRMRGEEAENEAERRSERGG